MNYPETLQIDQLVKSAQNILILQADNPDGDSLGSALALESIFGDMGKNVYLYCGVDMPTYMRHMEGWSRVNNTLPSNFDLSVIVDASTTTLFDAFSDSNTKGILSSKPCIVLDHHEITDNPIPFVSVIINDGKRASTGELIFMLSKDLNWDISKFAGEYIMNSILGDTQGLSNELTSSYTYLVMAELIDLGVNRTELEEKRREFGKMPEPIFRYKANLINRVELHKDNQIAVVTIPQTEINTYSPMYNPAPLIQNDILQTKDVRIAIVFKQYDSGRITAAIRSNYGYSVAGKLAEHFGGGGHKYASGFKINGGKSLSEIKNQCINYASELLESLNRT